LALAEQCPARGCPKQVAGLWIIMGMVGAFSLLLVGFQNFWLWHEFNEDLKHGTTLTRQATAKALKSLGSKSSSNLAAKSGQQGSTMVTVADQSRRCSMTSEVSAAPVHAGLPATACQTQGNPASSCIVSINSANTLQGNFSDNSDELEALSAEAAATPIFPLHLEAITAHVTALQQSLTHRPARL
jgi:hypothetical protein